MQAFNGVLNSRKRGIYKSVLDSSNQDYLGIDNNANNTTLDSFTFIVTTENMGSNSSNWQLISAGLLGVGNGLVSFYFLSSGLIICDIYDDTGSLVVNTNGGVQSNLDDVIEWSFDGVVFYRNGSPIIDLTSFGTINLVLDTSKPVTVNRLGYISARIGNMDVRMFSLNGELFSLNEASGNIFYGDNSSTGIRNTSNADGLDYINNTMIQRYGTV